MRRICAVLAGLLFFLSNICGEDKGDGLCIIFWNLENFFDYFDNGGGESDNEFSSGGPRHWTKKRFNAKSNAIAKAVLWIGERYGRMPDAIGLAEVENRFTLWKLTEETALRKLGYGIVHYESPDRRGIDVALLYRKETFSLIGSKPLRIEASMNGDTLRTRDILLVNLSHAGKELAILVNHHPSKYGGGDTDWRREAATARMKAAADSLAGLGIVNIISAGDFNDTPENVDSGNLVNLAAPLADKGEGSIRFNGKWELIDMFMVSPSLAPLSEMEIVKVPFLMTWDNTHPGYRPLRTYLGPRYTGGVSDHCPIVLKIKGL